MNGSLLDGPPRIEFWAKLEEPGIELQCNELNRGHPTFFYQSQDEFRTKESEFIHFGPIANEGLAVKSSFPSTKRQLKIF